MVSMCILLLNQIASSTLCAAYTSKHALIVVSKNNAAKTTSLVNDPFLNSTLKYGC